MSKPACCNWSSKCDCELPSPCIKCLCIKRPCIECRKRKDGGEFKGDECWACPCWHSTYNAYNAIYNCCGCECCKKEDTCCHACCWQPCIVGHVCCYDPNMNSWNRWDMACCSTCEPCVYASIYTKLRNRKDHDQGTKITEKRTCFEWIAEAPVSSPEECKFFCLTMICFQVGCGTMCLPCIYSNMQRQIDDDGNASVDDNDWCPYWCPYWCPWIAAFNAVNDSATKSCSKCLFGCCLFCCYRYKKVELIDSLMYGSRDTYWKTGNIHVFKEQENKQGEGPVQDNLKETAVLLNTPSVMAI